MKKFLSLSTLIFASSVSHAVMTINGFSGVSSYTITPTTATPGTTTPVGTATAVVYGGTAGIDNVSSGTCGAGQTCNTCLAATSCNNPDAGLDQAPLCACNTKAIYPTLAITVSVTKNPPSIGTSRLRVSAGTPGAAGSADLTQVSNADSATFLWTDVCGRMANSSNACDGSSDSLQVTIWDDKNGDTVWQNGEDQIGITVKLFNPSTNNNIYGETKEDGVNGFEPFPGDERIYFKSLSTKGSFPIMEYGGTIKAVRTYVSTTNMDNAVPGKTTIDPQDMPVPANAADLERPYIDNVVNGQRYFVRVALVDQAENVVQFYPGQTTLGAECTSSPSDLCQFAVTPEKVLGLLTKDLNCFVATAAYGSSLEPKLKVFRDFRMELLSHSWGKKLVLAYYDYGPYAARFIAESEVLRSVTRGFLWPLLGFSWLSVHYGFYTATALALTLLFSLSALILMTIRRIGTRV